MVTVSSVYYSDVSVVMCRMFVGGYLKRRKGSIRTVWKKKSYTEIYPVFMPSSPLNLLHPGF